MRVITMLIVLLLFKGKIKKFFREIRQDKFDTYEAQTSNPLAQQYRSVANPLGISWMVNIDRTSGDAIER